MGWLRRGDRSRRSSDEPSDGSADEAVERSTPGVAALLDGLDEDGSHAVLDLGAAVDANLRLYGRFASRIRFADLLSVRSRRGLTSALDEVPPQPDRPYDLVFAWDTLDRLFPPERPLLVERLVEVSAADARLHAVFRSSDAGTTAPLRFVLTDVDRMRYEPAGPPRSAGPPLLPTEVEELLSPFRVVRGFTLRGQLREYVAVRGEATAAGGGAGGGGGR